MSSSSEPTTNGAFASGDPHWQGSSDKAGPPRAASGVQPLPYELDPSTVTFRAFPDMSGDPGPRPPFRAVFPRPVPTGWSPTVWRRRMVEYR